MSNHPLSKRQTGKDSSVSLPRTLRSIEKHGGRKFCLAKHCCGQVLIPSSLGTLLITPMLTVGMPIKRHLTENQQDQYSQAGARSLFSPKIFLSKPEGEKPEASSTNDPEVEKDAKNQR